MIDILFFIWGFENPKASFGGGKIRGFGDMLWVSGGISLLIS
jgi:hypothetical protein